MCRFRSAPLAGVVADALGVAAAIWMTASLMFGSGLVVAFRMSETLGRVRTAAARERTA